MRKVLLLLLVILCSCSKTIVNDKKTIIKPDFVIQYRNDTTYYYKIINYEEYTPVIDSVYTAKQYLVK